MLNNIATFLPSYYHTFYGSSLVPRPQRSEHEIITEVVGVEPLVGPVLVGTWAGSLQGLR